MASGTVTVKVRPLRIGFLVDPADRVGLYQAIELSTFLWGGSYNPIIPAYRRTPSKWEPHRVRHLPSPSEIVEGYLNGFDPDLVVPVGICVNRTFQVGNRDIVKAGELIGDLEDSTSPRYGIGLVELLKDFIKKELKYKRNDDLQFSFLEFPRAYGLFLASVFGAVSKTAQQIINNYFFDVSGIVKVQATLKRLPELIRSKIVFPKRLNCWELEKRPLHGARLFVCDATSTQDIIDYWNLRAAGYYAVPIPIQTIETESLKNFARDFIEDNFYRPYRHNPEMYRHATVQRSRSVAEGVVKSFCESLNIPKGEDKLQHRFGIQMWYPRLWDSWARENAYGEGVKFPFAYEEERRISDDEDRLELRIQAPRIETFQNYSGWPKFANELSFRFYGSKELMAEVFPEGGRGLSSAIGRIFSFQWRFSRFGPVFLAITHRDYILLHLPLAEAVMTGWFRERGWKISLSGPGRIAKQLLKQLGGTSGISWLAHKEVINLLTDLEKEAGMPRQAVVAQLKCAVESESLHISAEHFLKELIATNALKLGAKIQCPVCNRYNWYELSELDYALRCRFCISDFLPPLDAPKNIKWTYRAHGPFASSIAQGAFTVLLTLKMMSGPFYRGITPLFSYEAEKNGKHMEADLTCLYRPSTWNETSTYIIHAECKSFNRFEAKDISRMKELSSYFPGSALIFATLNSDLEESEMRLIRPLAIAERKKKLRGKPNSPVILLTGAELFSPHIEDKWGKMGSVYEEVGQPSLSTIADVTQQLHLRLPSRFEWQDAEWKKRSQKRVNKNADKKKTGD